MAAVCLSLRGNFDLATADVMESEFRSLMRGASVTVIAMTSDGKNVELREPTQAWSKDGKIEKSNELSACMRRSGKPKELAIGTTISRLEISSTAPLDVRGIYWSRLMPGQKELTDC